MVDINKYLEQVSGQTDPYGQNPFADVEATPENGPTPFADELPFRFTQFALNPSTEATSGQVGRSPVARSPYTSGAGAQELRALRDKIAGLPSTPPGQAPVLPTLTPDLGLADQMQITPEQPDMRWGLPIKEYQVPARLLEDYGGRNPVDLAIQYERGGSLRGQFGKETVDWNKYKDSPMTTVTGYDVERMLGTDKWNGILNAKSLDMGDEDRLFYNLAILPTSINPDLENKEHIASLAMRDFTDVNRGLVANPEALAAAAEMGYDVSSGQLPQGINLAESGFNGPLYVPDPNYKFNPEDAAYLLRTNPQASGLRGFGQQWAPTAIQAGAAAVLGTAAGGVLAPALGFAGGGAGATAGGAPSAGGLAGALSMPSGAAATGVNLAGNMALSVGAKKALEEAGIPLDSPLAQFLVQFGASAAGGLTSGAQSSGAGVEVGTATEEQSAVLQALDQAAKREGISVKEMAAQLGMSEGELFEAVRTSGIVTKPSSYAGGFAPPAPTSGPDFKRPVLGGLQSGIQTYAEMTGQPTGGGVSPEQMYDPNAYTPEQLAEYDAAMANYNKMMDDYALRLQLQQEYEQKMSDFMEQSNAYKTYNMLRSQQEQLRSGIQSNIAENPFYQADPRLRGIQSGLID